MKEKKQYWQIVRGSCILAVIMIHCPQPTGDQNLWLIIRQLIDFPVAMFIFLAGYFVNPDKADYRWVLKRGGVRLIIPYLIWSVAFLFIDSIRNGFDAKKIVYCLVFGKSAAPLYYIIVLLQLLIITPWLVKHRKNWMYLVTPIYLCFLYCFNICTGQMPTLYETAFPAWFLFYLLGLDCKAGKFELLIRKSNFGWILLALMLSIAETYSLLMIGCSSAFAASQIRFSPFVYTGAIAFWLLKNERVCNRNILSRVGDCSYGMFYLHMLPMMAATKVLRILGLDNLWMVYWSLSFVVVSIISAACVWISRKVIKNKSVLKLVGFD